MGEALRGFGDEANNPDSQLHRHPMDFVIYHVGFFDQVTGEMEHIDPVGYGTAHEHSTPLLQAE